MADIFRQMQKTHCRDGRPNGGTFTYGCPCCRKFSNLRYFKRWSRKTARAQLKRMDDEVIGTRH